MIIASLIGLAGIICHSIILCSLLSIEPTVHSMSYFNGQKSNCFQLVNNTAMKYDSYKTNQ